MWDQFEERIRSIASYRWNRAATTETIAGVKCDCVLKLNDDEWVLVEITEQSKLDKVRQDVAKLVIMKQALFSEYTFARCYLVMKDTPTDSMRAAGNAQKVYVQSASEFQSEYFQYQSYVYIRQKKQFGSLINIETGEPENNSYIDVMYYNAASREEVSIAGIIEQLKRGKRVILKGDFGLGKSRCVKQVFDTLTSDPGNNPYAIAINLRDHWGAKRASEILSRHFADLGIEATKFIATYEQTNAIFLLDGFDEIGTQSWSSNPQVMQHLREVSVCAVKDLIEKARGGVLITGREYYFNSDQEMLSCLGLTKEKTVILECQHEFTEEQLLAYVRQNLSDDHSSENVASLPEWLPKRPLVMQLLMRYAGNLFSNEYEFDNIYKFWNVLISKICVREASIYPSLNPDVIKKVLLYLADFTRTLTGDTGPISHQDLSNAFLFAAGVSPSDESTIMLQRLPSIGRVSADSPDRQFVDGFVLNGLRAESVIQATKSWSDATIDAEWKHPLDINGLSILTEYIGEEERHLGTCLSLAKRASNGKNRILAADIVSAICLLDVSPVDFRDLYIADSDFSLLSFENKEIEGLSISDSFIGRIDLTNSKLKDDVTISGCLISKVYGVSSEQSVPAGFVDCAIESFEALSTSTRIRRANISKSQKMLVEMLRKLYFQPGAGRKEAALLRGMGASADKRLAGKILSILMDEGIVTRYKAGDGFVYKPVRSEFGRISKVVNDLTLSKDPIWIEVSSLQ